MKKLILPLILLSLLSSCAEFLDVNADLDSPYTSTPDFLLPPVIANTATSIFDHGEAESYLTQQVATLSGFNKYKDRWDYVTANRIAQWRRHFHDVSVNAKHVIQAAEREESTNYIGVARILYAFSTQMTTDVFGPMPYSEALNGNPSPKYDAQDYIYERILEELDLAIDELENTNLATCRRMTNEEDIVYGGDIEKWINFAYAIKARTLLHLTPNVSSNYSEVIAAADRALEGWEDALFDYGVGNENPLQINQWGPSKADPGWDYANNILDASAPSKFMLESALHYDAENNVVNDPRQRTLMKPNSEGIYLSVEPSQGKIATLRDEDYPDLYDSYMTRDRAKMPFFTEEELLFIKSEAHFQSGDKASAFNAFLEGIRVNMERAEVEDNSEIQGFLESEFIPADAEALTLSDIMMQKYVALYLQGEVWVDMRRHDYSDLIYPQLKRPRYLVFYWDEDNDDEWIERFPYDTETEEIYNKPSLEALGAYQNPEWLKVPMFWAK